MSKLKVMPAVQSAAMALGMALPAWAGSVGNAYSYTDIAVPGQFDSTAAAINESGVVVGEYGINNGGLITAHGYAYENGSFTLFDPKPGRYGTVPQAIGDGGLVVGYYLADKHNTVHGFTFNDLNGRNAQLNVVPSGTVPYGVNKSGQIVGFYSNGNGYTAFLKSGGSTITLQAFGSISTSAVAINDKAEVAGSYLSADNQFHGFVYSEGAYTMAEPHKAHSSSLHAINKSGAAAGTFVDSSFIYHGYTVNGHRVESIDAPNASSTNAVAINDLGQVAGTYADAAGEHQYGYLRQASGFVTIVPPGAVATTVTGLNNAGTVVGYYIGTDMEQHAFMATCAAGAGQCTQ